MENFNFENFKTLLEEKNASLSEVEASEFFDEISSQLEEFTNVFDLMSENEILERLTEMLVIMPPNALLELNMAKISALLKCSASNFRDLCYKFSQNLVSSNDYYSVDTNEIDYILTKVLFEDDQLTVEERKEKDKLFEKEHYVQSFDLVDDFDKDCDCVLIEV